MDALDELVPTTETYARLPVADAFNWADCAPAIEPGEWYLVAFRSTVRPDADIERLREYDDWAHAEASGTPGFVHYFKGPLASDGTCLSFCLWNSRAEARATAGRPAHREAVAIVSRMYAAYTLEFISLRKTHPAGSLDFSPYDTDQQPAALPITSQPSLGFSPAPS